MTNKNPTMVARKIESTNKLTGARTTLFVADGPDGHEWLLARLTESAALTDGLAYFTATRKLDASGRWVIA